MTKIAIMGYGVVGKGIADVIADNSQLIENKTKSKIEIKYILDLLDFPGDVNEKKIIHDFNIILNDPEISIVCEVMGGKGAAYKFTKALLLGGKSVVTSNKELVATYGDELIKIANEKGVKYMFEASVGGGIPVLWPLDNCLCANDINMVYGIVNGTSNYILTEMKYGKTFDEALKDAQKKGYAEADPTADIEGIDACRKACILSALAFGILADPEAVPTTGISNITAEQMEEAANEGYSIRLIAIGMKRADGKIYISVAPYKVKKDNPLFGIDGVFNGIVVNGNKVGNVMFYGPGAGSRPTASAVVADVMNVILMEKACIKIDEWAKNPDAIVNCMSDDDWKTVYENIGYPLYKQEGQK